MAHRSRGWSALRAQRPLATAAPRVTKHSADAGSTSSRNLRRRSNTSSSATPAYPPTAKRSSSSTAVTPSSTRNRSSSPRIAAHYAPQTHIRSIKHCARAGKHDYKSFKNEKAAYDRVVDADSYATLSHREVRAPKTLRPDRASWRGRKRFLEFLLALQASQLLEDAHTALLIHRGSWRSRFAGQRSTLEHCFEQLCFHSTQPRAKLATELTTELKRMIGAFT